MLFSSPVFIFAFLGTVIPIYYLLKRFTLAKNIFLFAASIVFFSWGEPKYLILLMISVVMNHIFGLLCGEFRESKPRAAKVVLWVMVAANLSMLFVFKYLVFFMENFKFFSGIDFTIPVIELPLGISFFTFQAMSYVIDVYFGNGKAQKNILYTGLYVVAFPQLVAGPIVRYETVAEQINYRRETLEDFSRGICRFTAGLIKKVLISNQMAMIADAAYGANLDSAQTLSAAMAWLGALAYMLQIYYDFSGYSDMAIGLGQVFGFKYDENFDFPYASRSVSEFWRRWHISLGTWFKSYVYIPLGGSRVGKVRLIFNLLAVWTLTGIWHGAEWTFLLWGIYYFAFLCLEKLFPAFFKKFPSILRLIGTQAVVYFGWIMFRAENLGALGSYISAMFGSNTLIDSSFLRWANEKWFFLAAAIVFSFPICALVNKKLEEFSVAGGVRRLAARAAAFLYPIVYTMLFLISVSYLLKGTYNPFIYFNF